MRERVLVTGGARGIGRAIAERCRSDRYEVVILDRVTPPDGLADQFIAVDLMDEGATAAAFAKALTGGPLTRLVNNAGLVAPASLEDTKLADFDAVMRLNARLAVQAAQAVLPGMKAARFGRIVSISSRALLGKELRTAYAASKAALLGLSRTWALELGPQGITVNLVAPGPIETELFRAANPPNSPTTKAIIEGVPVRRMGQPEDIAHAVGFFLSADAGFVTGQTLFVCGGLTVGHGL
jgi:NAD(P)-dependent dehydrogenase (short-subunit alcohol dehydrogenase family)